MKDIMFDSDLVFESGDFKVDDSAEQHIQHILTAAPGHYKQYPLIGADVTKMLNGPVGLSEKIKIKTALNADGFTVKNIIFNQEGIQIDAE